MRFTRYCLIVLAVLAVTSLGMTGCRKGGKIASISITPAGPGIAYGTTVQMFATALFTSGNRYDWTSTALWSSSDESVATISNAVGTHGLVTSVSKGTTVITAVDLANDLTTTTLLTVAAPVMLTITPVNPRMAVGTTHQFSAIATLVLSDATTTTRQDVTSFVSWTSSATGVASVTSAQGTIGNGLVAAIAAGSTVISATDPRNVISSSATLTVTGASLTSITVSPSDLSIAPGLTQQFVATGAYGDGSFEDLTSSVTWGSSNGAVAVISNETESKGLATSGASGTTTISATDPVTNISVSTNLTVTL